MAKSSFFQKNTDTMPFFSLHPKTKLGMIVRIAMYVFMMLMLLVSILMALGYKLIWYDKLYDLVILVPIAGTYILMIVGLYKRISVPAFRLSLCVLMVLIGYVGITIFWTAETQLSQFRSAPIARVAGTEGSVYVMGVCLEPEAVEGTAETDTPLYAHRIGADVFTVRAASAGAGEGYAVEGEITVPAGDESSYTGYSYTIAHEWTDEDTLRVYISKDTSGLGHGEIIVRFFPSETQSLAENAPEDASPAATLASEDGKRSVNVYKQPGYLTETVSYALALSPEDMTRGYTAHPAFAGVFLNGRKKTEGAIYVEPYGALTLTANWIEPDVVTITPGEDSVGATGQITVWLNEQMEAEEKTEQK